MIDIANGLAGAVSKLPRTQSEAYRATQTDDFLTREQVFLQLATLPDEYPRPCGYRVLVLALTMPNKVGEIEMIDQTLEAKSLASPQGVVLKLGPDVYKRYDFTGNPEFPSGPWCEIGDRVLFSKYAGRGFRLANGQLLFVLNDDEIIGVVDGGYQEAIR